MREIKFKAWDKKYKKMYHGGDIRIALAFPDEDIEFMQYTGLSDKAGKEIYEGDILSTLKSKKVQRGNQEYIVIGEWVPDVVKVEWREGILCIGWSISKTQAKEGEIIGDIYNNPELLEVNP